jgi:hypothetical protein
VQAGVDLAARRLDPELQRELPRITAIVTALQPALVTELAGVHLSRGI